MAINILLLALILLRVVTGVDLLKTARKNNLPNLKWMVIYFLGLAFGVLFAPAEGNPLANFSFSLLFFSFFAAMLPLPMIILFNQATFYQGKKSPAGWFWLVSLIGIAAAFYGIFVSESNYNQSPWVAGHTPAQILVFAWHGMLASQALSAVSKEKAVEDWVKSRYRLVIVYSLFIALGNVASFIRIVFAGGSTLSTLGATMSFITLLCQIAAVVLQFLVWAMPEGFRNWLNRNYQTRLDEQIHQQAAVILDILGAAMSENTGLDKWHSLMLIRRTIGAQIHTQDSKLIEAHALRLGYNEWLALLASPELHKAITISANMDTALIINKARQTLGKNQSLFTMQAK